MSRFPSFLGSTPPPVGVEIASDRVAAVSLGRQGNGWAVTAHAMEALPAGVVTPALNAVNVRDAAQLAGAIRSAFDRLGSRPKRVSLVIPDTAAKISLLRFEKVPAAPDLEQLIRWQVRKAAPFKPEEAQVSWVPASPLADGGREFLVTLARRDIIESYEAACASAGAHAGVVDISSLNLINAALAASSGSPDGDWLVVHVAPDYATLAIVRGRELIFYRTRQLEGSGDLADVVHQTAMYHEDRLDGKQFARVVLSGTAARGANTGDRVRRNLEDRLGVKVEPLDFRGGVVVRDRINASAELLDALAPAMGVVLRERVA